MIKSIFSSTAKALEEHGLVPAALLCVVLIAVTFGIGCLVVWICTALWNVCLVAAIPFITKEVTFWQMWGIYLLFHLLRSSINSNKND